MPLRRDLRGFAALLAVTLWGVPAGAVELVPGGYGAASAVADADWARSSRLALGAAAAPLVVQFTPRTVGALLVPRETGGLAGGAIWERAADGFGGTLDRLGLSSPTEGGSDFVVGGAFRLDDVVVAAAFARPTLLGTPSELFAAGMSVGGVSATFGYARRFEPDSDPLDLLMLRTDLEALPWLSFESEVAVGESADDGSFAVGRIGVRVNF